MPATPELVMTQQDFDLIPLLNAVAEPIAGSATPSAGSIGRLYRNTTTNRLEYVKDATTIWSIPASGTIVDADINAAAAIALSKLATNPLARANHTGTQLAATISDFDSQVNTHALSALAAPTADVSMASHKLTNLTDGVSAQDAVSLQQVTNLLSAAVNGQDWKSSARVASSSNVNIASPGTTVDGVTMATNDRVLLAGQTTASQNGIYVWNGSAVPMTRSTDADASVEVTAGMTVPIAEGTHQDTMAILTTNDAITLGTTSLAFTFLSVAGSYTASGSIQVVGNVISIVSGGVSIAEGGTAATTAAGARTSLNVPQRGYAQDLGALTAGTGLDVTHSLGTLDVVVQVYRKSDGATVRIGTLRKDVNTVTVTADVAVSTGVLRIIVEPVA